MGTGLGCCLHEPRGSPELQLGLSLRSSCEAEELPLCLPVACSFVEIAVYPEINSMQEQYNLLI